MPVVAAARLEAAQLIRPRRPPANFPAPAMLSPDTVRQYISDTLPCEHLEVSGDGAHFEALIVSSVFEGRSRVQRHQAVYKALGDRMREEIHALSMQTLTPAEWRARA